MPSRDNGEPHRVQEVEAVTAFGDLLIRVEDGIEAWVMRGQPSEARAWLGITALLPVLAVAGLVYWGRDDL
jgi:hypothetical protein